MNRSRNIKLIDNTNSTTIQSEICRLLACTGIFLITVFSSCNSKDKTFEESSQQTCGSAELALPEVPDSIKLPVDRADYVIAHFWDMMNFADTTISLDTAFMEQNFVNYIQLYDYASEDGRSRGTERLMGKAGVMESTYRFVADIAERYLTDLNSPMRNEEHFLPFIEVFVNNTILPPEEKIRYEYLKTKILKNRPGTIGADFSFIDRCGKLRSLGNEVKEVAYTLLLFYDYDCETCAGVEKEMMTNLTLNSAIDAGLLNVVAVNVFGNDLSKWKRLSTILPDNWTVGYSPENELVDKEFYCVDAAPTLYFLDSDRKVILKDARLADVISLLDTILRNNRSIPD